jgi:hypothetical protein
MIVSHLIEAVLISILGLLLRWENQKRDRIQSQMEGGLEGRDLDATAFLDLTDRENLKYVPLCRPASMLLPSLESGMKMTNCFQQFPIHLLSQRTLNQCYQAPC